MGLTTLILVGVRPNISLASLPTACTSPVRSSRATAEGSLTTMPRPRAKTRVLTVPKSIAKSAENKLNNGRRLLRETRVTQSKRITPTGLIGRAAKRPVGSQLRFLQSRPRDWPTPPHGAPHCADDGP